MGSNKLLVNWKGAPLVQWTLSEIQSAPFSEVIAVTGHDGLNLSPILRDVRVVNNPHFDHGMHSSIRAGLKEINLTEGFVAICLGDQPLLNSSDYDELISKADLKFKLIYPSFNGERGNPVLINLSLREEILSHPDDDRGCSYLFKRYPQSCLEVRMSTDACLRDVDTPEALNQLRSRTT